MAKFAVACVYDKLYIEQAIVEADYWLDALSKLNVVDADTLEAWQQDGHCQDAARGQANDDGWDFCVTEIK